MLSDQRRAWLTDRLPLAALCSAGLAHLAYHVGYTVDDAYITFRYSRNLARGAGAVFNPGEYVKGYSNTLYMWLMALPELVHRDPIVFSKAIGVAAYLALLVALYRDSRQAFGPALAALGAPALFVLSMPLAVWYVAGLETGFYTTCIVVGVLCRLREQESGKLPYSAAWFIAALLSRPEGIIFFVAMAGHDLCVRVLSRRWPRISDLVWYLLPPAVYATELLISKAYYGAYFPSTFYAKVAHSQSLTGDLDALWRSFTGQWRQGSYLRHGLDTAGGLWSVGLAAAGLLHLPRLRQHSAFLLMFGAQCAFLARAGGDWMPAARFCVPLLPFLFLLMAGGVAWLAARWPSRQAIAAPVLAAACLGGIAWDAPLVLRASGAVLVSAEPFLSAGQLYTSLLPPGALLSSYDVGGLSYAGGLDVLDTAGLTDDIITRCKARVENCLGYATALMPDLVRRHPQKKKGDFVYKELKRTHAYLEVSNERFLLKRALALVGAPPAWARDAASAGDPADAAVVALEAPEHTAPGRRLSAVLYWRATEATRASVVDRRILLVRKGTTTDSEASPTMWVRFTPVELWDTRTLFADRVSFAAPVEVGTYQVVVELADHHRQVLGSLQAVTGDAAVRIATKLASSATSAAAKGSTDAAIALLREALWTHDEEAIRAHYDRVAIARARVLLAAAQAAKAAAPAAALLRQARQLLHQAYWETGRASHELRSAIDPVGAEQRRLVLTLLHMQP